MAQIRSLNYSYNLENDFNSNIHAYNSVNNFTLGKYPKISQRFLYIVCDTYIICHF